MAGKKILVVDDDPEILTVLQQRLLTCGYDVHTAKNGEEACAKARSVKPDLIIMDVLMPKMSGYDALRKIRDDNELRKIPAIMVSALGVMRDFFTDLSNVEFMAKPFEAQELLGKVSRFLDGAAATVRVVPAVTPTTSPSATATVSAPPPVPEKHRSVIVLGVQDVLTGKILSAVSAMGIEAERALNEDDACKVAQKIRPEKIFCQFWEDDKVLDAKKLADRFLKTPGLAAVSFYVFCEDRSSLEVMKLFREDKIISYRESGDLLVKIKDLLSAAV